MVIKMKKPFFFVIFMLTLSVMAGCKSDAPDRSFFYSYDEIAVDLEIGQILDFAHFEDKLILVGRGDEDSRSILKMITLSLDGSVIADARHEENFVHLANVDSLGRVWAIGSRRNMAFCAATEYAIMCFDNGGELIKTIRMTSEDDYDSSQDSFVVGFGPDDDEYFYILKAKIFHQGNRLGELSIFEGNGIPVYLISKPSDNIMDLFRLADGRVFIRTLDKGILEDPEAEMSISCLCIRCKDECYQEERAKRLHDTFGYAFLGGSKDYDIIMASKVNVYGSDLKGERAELLNWMAEGVDNNSTYKHTIAAGGLIYTLKYIPSSTGGYSSGGKTSIVKLTRKDISDRADAANNDAKPKKTVNVAALYTNEIILSAVAKFNQASPDYRIDIKTYSDSYWADDEAINAFHIDLAAGHMPDMVFLTPDTPNLSYAAKGLFADLYELMDSDPDFDQNDYLTNILRLLETDGKLNFAATSFGVITLMGRVSEWGERLSFTWDEYDAFLASRPADVLPIGGSWYSINAWPMTKEAFLSATLTQKMSEFVDFETGLCSFENISFTQLLHRTERFPLNREDYTVPLDFQSGNPPLLWLGNFHAFSIMSGFAPQLIKADTFAEEIVYLGFPANEAVINGSICNPFELFAVFEKAKEKDGAWEFAKYLLTDFQETAGMGLASSLSGFPLKISALEFLVKEAEKPEPYEIEYIDRDGMPFYVLPPTDREIERVLELVDSLIYIDLTDKFIMSIILEEAGAYFTGQKTPEQVAEVVQNRVSIYLKEIG
jgi:ABC-type glycerol-3-phosphate transport system substrate-binding protein